jgi:membrane fusion protein (multidrug efflux system)
MDQNVAAFEKAGEDVPVSGTGSGARPVRNRRRTLRSALVGVGVIGLLTTGTLYGQYWWRTGRFLASTDDAYLQADNVIISPKISGYLLGVPVTDNEPVHAGQVLARIDDRDYRTTLAAAQADVAAQEASIDNLTQQIGEQQLLISEARATVNADRAAQVFARQDDERYTTLSKSGVSTIQNAQQATADLQEKEAALDRDTVGVSAAEKQVDVLNAQLAEARAVLAQKQAALRQAELNEGYTTITSPVDGTVGVRTLRVGQYVQAGTQLMAIVPLQAVYVTANYKETQLTDVRPGQPVTLKVDTFPGAEVHGVVNSIAPASGQEFALLPPDNATGNFTKIVQRVPVKITIDPDDPLIGQLRPGMSVEPTIDTKPKA